jgi:hypothetical protein
VRSQPDCLMLMHDIAQMATKRPRQVLTTACGRKKGPTPNVFAHRGQAETAAATSQHRAEKITVTIDADLLQCCVCCGPLTTPLFQVYILCAESISHAQCFRTCNRLFIIFVRVYLLSLCMWSSYLFLEGHMLAVANCSCPTLLSL